MIKSVAIFLTVFGVACAYPQILVPTSVSQQSGIVRTIPTTLLGIPVNNVLNDRDRVAIATQLTIEQLIANRLNNNQNRNLQDQLNRDWNQQRINNRINDLNDQTADQIRTEQILRTAEQLRNEQIRDELDRNENIRRTLQNTGNAALTTSQLRTAVSGRLI